jgi:centrobin
MENQVLVDNLECEKFRRQHCEKQIWNLQSRLLETQEQLAVAVSTEKKKDIMIEQLDKVRNMLI